MTDLENIQTWDAERIRLELAHACALKALLSHMGWPASLTVPFDGVEIEIRKAPERPNFEEIFSSHEESCVDWEATAQARLEYAESLEKLLGIKQETVDDRGDGRRPNGQFAPKAKESAMVAEPVGQETPQPEPIKPDSAVDINKPPSTWKPAVPEGYEENIRFFTDAACMHCGQWLWFHHQDRMCPKTDRQDWMCRHCTAGPFTHVDLERHWQEAHAK